jgi:predicted amidohydrolase
VCLTAVGRLGLYSAAEGLVSEVTRGLALSGAQILLNSLQSFAVDQATLHVPVRAAENKVWVVAANAVGPMLPPDDLVRAAAHMGVPTRRLHATGESQIVAPDGTVVAKAPSSGEAVVIADIEPGWADDKTRPDGTDLFAARRPWAYTPITDAPPAPALRPPAADRLPVAVVRPTGNGMTAIDNAADLVRRAASAGAALVVLPELFLYPDGRADGSFLDGIAVDALIQALDGTTSHVVTSLPDDSVHAGLLISASGVRGRQLQLHHSIRHIAWHAAPGDGIEQFDMPWGRLAIIVGDDALYPETFRLAAITGADVVAVPFTPYESWELRVGLLERAAENRVNIVAAGHHGPGGAGAILGLPEDFTLCSGRSGTFAGMVSHPLVTPVGSADRLVTGDVHPARSRNRKLASDTDLVDGRPWQLAGALVR